jgi:hypothetical protein
MRQLSVAFRTFFRFFAPLNRRFPADMRLQSLRVGGKLL